MTKPQEEAEKMAEKVTQSDRNYRVVSWLNGEVVDTKSTASNASHKLYNGLIFCGTLEGFLGCEALELVSMLNQSASLLTRIEELEKEIANVKELADLCDKRLECEPEEKSPAERVRLQFAGLVRHVLELREGCPDRLDMFRDEFLRIKALNPTSEIVGICDRALLQISRNAPVIDELEQLKKQNKALNAVAKAAEEVNKESDCSCGHDPEGVCVYCSRFTRLDNALKTLKASQCDHDWELIDSSFDHEFGTEQVFHMECSKCDATKPCDKHDHED